jgi:hypothetical protein
VSKIKDGASKNTKMQIYYLKNDCSEPLIEFTTAMFENFQAGFFIRENKDKDIGKIRFVLKGVKSDYACEYEFKDESLQEVIVSEINPKCIK